MAREQGGPGTGTLPEAGPLLGQASNGARRDLGGDAGTPPDLGHQPREPEIKERRGVRRAGSGGRWLLWLGRAVLWAFIIVVVVNGVRAPFVNSPQPEPAPATPAKQADPESRFPASEASAFALQFADAYLNYSSDAPAERGERLSAFLPGEAADQLGWNGSGAMRLDNAQVAGVDARGAHHGVVTLSVLINQRWMRLAVPIYARRDRLVVSGKPALLPPPAKAALPDRVEPASDLKVAEELRERLPGFFQAYADSDRDALEGYVVAGSSLDGLGGAVRFLSLDELAVPRAKGSPRQAIATVTWQVPSLGGVAEQPARLQQTYELTVTTQSHRWWVKEVHASTFPDVQ